MSPDLRVRSGSSKRARLIVLEEAEPALELGIVGALLGSEAPEGAIVIAAGRVIDRWLRLPGNLTVGLVSATPVVEAIRSAASRAEAGA